MMDKKFHIFTNEEMKGMELPQQFTFPFYYIPHPLCIIAAKHVQAHLETHPEWKAELQEGKMMGVLIVEKEHEIGFLSAFSGNLAHSNNHRYFVPAIYDLLSEDGFFCQEEEVISAINKKIDNEIRCPERANLIEKLKELETQANHEISTYQQFMKVAKAQRDEQRKSGIDSNRLIAESQFQKAELKRIKAKWAQEITTIKEQLIVRDTQVSEWKTERQQLSISLQKRIFRHFIMLNARGESKDLCDIFINTPQVMPPAGAGECAAPKLLQYAYKNNYKPIAMAEFWIGNSPKDEIRRHGQFYPSCKAKCEPILNWMLQGLDVEQNPLNNNYHYDEIQTVFEDDWLIIVNKPAGMLSVPGKLSVNSLQEQVQRLYPDYEQLFIVHRLDMATSGLLIFAKTKTVHKRMQSMFKTREIKKRYIAILDGVIETDSGIIELPLILNPHERPLQCVNHTHGKSAITRFEVIERKNGKTLIAFHPETGRTHQLRVHSAHPEGLNTPIVGDNLYGTPADRLYLHAEALTFIHPVTNKKILITTPAPFTI